MKKSLILLFTIFTAYVLAEDSSSVYFRSSIGLPFSRTFSNYPTNVSVAFRPTLHIARGHKYNEYMSAELEGGFIYYPISISSVNSSVRSLNLLINLIMHPKQLSHKSFQMFFGIGAGYSNNSSDDARLTLGSIASKGLISHGFARQAFLGCSYTVNSKFSWVADVRYMSLDRFAWETPSIIPVGDLSTAMLTLGGKYQF